MMAHGTIGTAIHELRHRVEGIAVAFVSCDGELLFSDAPGFDHLETFAVMCATVLGAAGAAAVEMNRSPPDRVLLEGPDAWAAVVRSGAKAFLVAVLEPTADRARVLEAAGRLAEALRVD